jgi:hydroxymethylglutaryl-CoA lyase
VESVEEYARLIGSLPPGIRIRLNVATAFDCPFQGPVPAEATLELLAQLIPVRPDAEVALCDTTGRATPDRVTALFEAAQARFAQTARWAFHGHDTYGLGVANVLAAFQAGVRTFDAAFAGLGGCPFAPGATGNVATEDVVWTFDRLRVDTGVHLDMLLQAAEQGAALPGALYGGRVRDALRGARKLSVTTEV